MKFSNLLMCVASVLMLTVMLFSAPTISHAELPPGGDIALMSLSDTMSTPSAMILADEALTTTSAVAAHKREHTFNLMDKHNITTLYPLKPRSERFIVKSFGLYKGWHPSPGQRKILLT